MAQTTGTYRLTFHFNTSSGEASRKILVDSVPVATDFSFSGTGSYPAWATATLKVGLVAGQNQIEVSRISESGNRNALQLYSLNSSPAGVGVQRFEAEDDSRTGSYMQETGMNVIYALNYYSSTDIPLSDTVAYPYSEDVNLLGMLHNWNLRVT